VEVRHESSVHYRFSSTRARRSAVEAKQKDKTKTVIGCVHGTANHYTLSTVTKKGKKREWDFWATVIWFGGRKKFRRAVRRGRQRPEVSSIKTLAGGCR